MRALKQEQRVRFREERKALPEKQAADEAIIKRLTECEAYRRAKTVLCYASLDEEIETDSLIHHALKQGKQVGLPVCENRDGTMRFYGVSSLSALRTGTFGVKEPDTSSSKRLENFENSIIIVPAIAFSRKGYRLGYGKGCYDSFLKKHPLYSVGLCYDGMIKDELITEQHDVPVNIIVTQTQIIDCANGGKNG